MDNREKNKLKFCKAESNRNQRPILKPDVILITKDVMVPVKLTTENCEKLYCNSRKEIGNKSKITTTERIGFQTLKQSYLEKVKKSEEKSEQELVSESDFYHFPKANEDRSFDNTEKADEVKKLKTPNLITEGEKPPVILSPRNSISSLTFSDETRSVNSDKSSNTIEDSFRKLIKDSISSSESDFEYRSKLPMEDTILNSPIRESTPENICCKEFIESGLNPNLDKVGEINPIEDKQITIDVKNLLKILLNDIDNCDGNTKVEGIFCENTREQKFSTSEYDPKERTPKIVEFRYSLRDLVAKNVIKTFDESSEVDLRKNYSSEEFISSKSNPDVDLNQSHDHIEVKYSWQIITPRNEQSESVAVSTESQESFDNEKNSKLTDTEDLNENKLDFQYSWQKLTAKYLSENRVGDSLLQTNKSQENIDQILTNTNNTEFFNDNSVPKNISRHNNLRRKDEDNYPVNNIISSMLPFNNNNLVSHLNDPSVSSIKHVIANLNAMVTTQRQMLDTYDKNRELNKKLNATESLEKVEIFPSTLHVLGNYIVRDICPGNMNDQRNLLDPSNEEDSKDNSIELENQRLDKPVKNVSDPDLSSKLISDLKDADFLSMLNDLAAQINNSKKMKTASIESKETRSGLIFPVPGKDRKLTKNNWDSAIPGIDEIMELSLDAARCIDEGKDDGNEAVPHTKNTGPLKPRVQVSFSETKEAGDSKSRRDELLIRLEGAMSRLKQCEQHVDANWNLDYSVLDIEESISDKEVKLPKQVEEHVKDIIKSAEEYLAKLEEQLNDLRNADDQIINSSERTFKDIDETYQLFMDNLCKEINKRRNLVRLETEVFKYEGLAPLRACKQEVDAQIRSTQHLIVLTENMLTHPITFNRERLGKIITATSHMGRIPAVPMPEELPYVTFSPPNDELKKEIVERISCVGCVLRMGPAQFTEVCERPGGLQLKWQLVDPDFASEEQTFVVQKALGEIDEPNSPAFHNVYVGQEMSCFVRDLAVDQQITLRVGIQVSDTAWSVHRIAKTSIPAYSWDLDNSDYLITNSGKIATKVTQNLSTLLSRGAQFSAHHIIEFKFLEASAGSDDEGIGLVFEPGGVDDSLKRNGAILITPNGSIFMNGEKKLMKLPKIELGTRIIFTSEPKDDETLRMNIECGNKAVTYDWTVPRPLHFVARFSESNKWNLMVK